MRAVREDAKLSRQIVLSRRVRASVIATGQGVLVWHASANTPGEDYRRRNEPSPRTRREGA
ncbi:MAG: hypothetical protein JO307_29010 [Bryobacterales bacterium]|nr:hypothetical protein [Bryobacterales bacterium]